MNETFDSSAKNFSPGNQPGYRYQNEVPNGMSGWKENLQDNWFVVLLGSVVITVGLFYLPATGGEKARTMNEILFRQEKLAA